MTDFETSLHNASATETKSLGAFVMVVKYIKGQRQHHLEGTVIPFLERVETEATQG